MPPSDVRIMVRGRQLNKWLSYQIESDLLQASDAFSFSARNTGGELVDAVHWHDEVEVYVDGTLQMTGYVDDVSRRSAAGSGGTIEVVGRDRAAPLVDCSAEPRPYNNIDLKALAEALAGEWVPEWIVHNDDNRRKLLEAKQRFARASRPSAPTKAALDETNRAAAHLARIKAQIFFRCKVEPGETPWEIIERHARRAGLMVWLTADGKGVIARPTYNQPPAFRLFQYEAGDPRARLNNIVEVQITDSGRERFSSYRVVGTSANTAVSYGRASQHDATVADDQVVVDRPLLLPASAAQKLSEARAEAEREMQRRRFEGLTITCTVKGHRNCERLWQPDTICAIDDRINGLSGLYYVTGRRFVGDEGGQRTEVTLHEPGVLLP